MTEMIVVALISFAGTCVGSWGGLKLMSYRIEQLEKKVDKHNNLIDRMYKAESNIEVIQEEIE